jgi:iron complex outermembrane receptor protein
MKNHRVLAALMAGAGAIGAGPALANSGHLATLDELVVTAPPTLARVLPPSEVVDAEQLLLEQPAGLDQALDQMTGVMVRVNSRGESVVRVRGAEERQTAVFIDGAPAAVPWDGRLDLGVLPVGLIGRVEVVKGAAPIEFGTNAVSGVAALQTRRGSEAGTGLTAFAEGGSQGYRNAAAVATLDRDDRMEATLAFGLLSRDGLTVADPDALPFSQVGGARRTNTDLDSWSAFGAVGADLGGVRLRASVLHLDASRGIAPEGHLDPAVDSPRFWRYPDIALTQVTINGEADLGAGTLRAVAWNQDFGQTIDAYSNVSYTTRRSREIDDDHTYGGRLTLSEPVGALTLRASLSGETSTHDQSDISFGTTTTTLDRRFRQDLFSAGLEVDHPIGERLLATWGAAYDRAETPLTGDKPPQAAMDAPAWSGALRWRARDDLSLTATAGRRTRFPSARELFGEALGRFQPNPDLRPETAWLSDLLLDWRSENLSLSINPFIIHSEGTISQRVVSVGGVSRRQRFNLHGARSHGVDATVRAKLHPAVTLEAGLGVLKAHASQADGGARLPQRPSYEANAAVEYAWRGAIARIEVHRTGGAVDLAPTGGQAGLPGSTVFNLRASAPVVLADEGRTLEVTGAIDNLTDELVLPQLGLPSPGRTVRIGLRFRS